MKKLKLLLLLTCFGFVLAAQDFEYSMRSQEEQRQINEFGEILVQVAIENHPDSKIALENVNISEQEHKISKFSWLNQISVNGNLNEASIDPPDTEQGQNLFFPRYNFGIQIPLGIFLTQPAQAKIGKKNVNLKQLEVQKMESIIRAEVLSAYNNYLLRKEIYNIKMQIAEEEKALMRAKEDKFTSGEIDLDEYTGAIRAYQLDVERLLVAKNEFDNSKIELEQWLGRRLEEINE